ncbi:MAG: DUF58 domain-containing protein [Candidatus Baltobacteraceae bacterium]
MRPVFPALWLAPRGLWALVILGVLLALAAVVPAMVVAFVAGVALLAGAIAADVVLGPTAQALRIVREPLGYLALARPARARYVLENRSRSALRVGIVESPAARIAFEEPMLFARVDGFARATVEQTFVPRERGATHFGTLYLAVENRIGVLRRRFAAPADVEVRVYPNLSAVESSGVLARRNTLLEAGLRKLWLRGVGNEFESLREYAAGDAFRNVDWKASARRGRLMVAQYEVERSQQVIVALDAGRLMYPRIGGARKFDYALTAALSVARVASELDDAVGLVVYGARERLHVAPRRGTAHHAALVRVACDLQPEFEEPDYEAAFANLRRRYPKRSLVVAFTDFFDPLASQTVLTALGALAPRHLVICVLMNDAAIERALAHAPSNAHDAYRASAAFTLQDERAAAIAALRTRGIIVVDVPAPRLTVALLDAYLEVKARGRL